MPLSPSNPSVVDGMGCEGAHEGPYATKMGARDDAGDVDRRGGDRTRGLEVSSGERVVGEIAEEAIEEAMENALEDAAFDASIGAVDLDRVGHEMTEAASPPSLGLQAGEAVEAAMTAADMASSIDAALDAADAARKIHKVGKAIRKIR